MSEMPTAPSLDVIQSQLNRTRRIWRTSETLSRSFIWVGAVLIGALAICGADNLFRLPSELRLVLGIALVLGALASLFCWLLRPMFWKINDQAAAVYLERKLRQHENLMINAVQLSDKMNDPDAPFSQGMAQSIVEHAATRAQHFSIQKLWDKQKLKRLAGAAIVAALLSAAYVGLLPNHAKNALLRLARPMGGVPPISNIRVYSSPSGKIEIFGGDRLSVEGLAIVDHKHASEDVVLVARVDGESHRIPMARSASLNPTLMKEAGDLTSATMLEGKGRMAQGFLYEFPNVSKTFSFYLVCGDGESSPCQVSVRERPAVQGDVNLEIIPPTYTGLQVTREPSASGLIHALIGSRASFDFKPTMPLKSAILALPNTRLELKGSKEGYWGGSFAIEKEGAYKLSLTSKEGIDAPEAFQGQIAVRADALPSAGFENSSLNIAVVPGATVPLALKAQDDFGLKSVKLVIEKGMSNVDSPETSAKSDTKEIKSWNFPIPGPKSVNELYPLALTPAAYPVGGTYVVYAEVTDHCPVGKRTVRSGALIIRVLTPEQMALPAGSPLASVFTRIQDLIEQQTKARGKTITAKTYTENLALDKALAAIREAQVNIQKNTDKLVTDLKGNKKEDPKNPNKMLKELDALSRETMTKAITNLAVSADVLKNKDKALPLLQAEESMQTEIINRLTALLGSVALADKNKKQENADLKDDQDSQRLRDKLEEAHDKVGKFIEEQKKVIKATEELEKKNPDDLTEEDKKNLGDLAKTETEFAKFFKEVGQDLSKVPNQDFSSSKMSEEFNEAYQEIQKAAEALVAKNSEIAVRAEQGGLELAKQIETNLEKWLPDKRDNIKWSMEEPKGEFDVPLADLPKELEDIIGDLVDEEEKMTDDVQDTSSSWMDSMDKGAGWDAGDGPISNMSAKGVTGNQLPNQQEVGGRSGEGRSGKSTGQFVEDTAQGKGGQQTPTRSTQDPYEEGQVKDTSKDPQGGSTGGGKGAGSAAGGLRGQPPPQTKEKMERLKDQQADIRQKAEKVTTQLKAYHLPASDCEEAVRRMKLIEDNLKAGKGFDLKQAHASVIDNLKEAQKVVGFQGEVNRERSRDLPKHVRNKIITGMHTEAPAGYQDLMEAYYKALVEPDNK
ncbi:MAG TPA: hypothetical protein VGP72_08295 [Planctomycetota bacterium]|jgi:hypothetical protein